MKHLQIANLAVVIDILPVICIKPQTYTHKLISPLSFPFVVDPNHLIVSVFLIEDWTTTHSRCCLHFVDEKVMVYEYLPIV